MKTKIIAIVILIIGMTGTVSATCSCVVMLRVYNDGIYTQYFAGIGQLTDVFIQPGDSLNFFVGSGQYCVSNDLVFAYNGDTLFDGQAGDPDPSYSYTAYDTGHYYMRYYFYFVPHIFDFNVHYSNATGIKNIINDQSVSIFPTVSSGLFKIKSEKKLKHLHVLDYSGRKVLETDHEFSEIDLSRFSPGIYFYLVTDEKQYCWRGKMIKE